MAYGGLFANKVIKFKKVSSFLGAGFYVSYISYKSNVSYLTKAIKH